jgi:hypothetical protein
MSILFAIASLVKGWRTARSAPHRRWRTANRPFVGEGSESGAPSVQTTTDPPVGARRLSAAMPIRPKLVRLEHQPRSSWTAPVWPPPFLLVCAYAISKGGKASFCLAPPQRGRIFLLLSSATDAPFGATEDRNNIPPAPHCR